MALVFDVFFEVADFFGVEDFFSSFFRVLVGGPSFSFLTGSGLIHFEGFFSTSSSFPHFPPLRILYNLVFPTSKYVHNPSIDTMGIPAWLNLYCKNKPSPAAKAALKMVDSPVRIIHTLRQIHSPHLFTDHDHFAILHLGYHLS